MKDEHLSNLIQYRIERAHETVQEALLMQRERHWNACANRLYYACFYAITALLAKEGLSSSKHSGVKTLFNKLFIKTGKVTTYSMPALPALYHPTKKGVQLKEDQFQRLIGKWTLVPTLLFHPIIVKKAYLKSNGRFPLYTT